MKKEELAEYIGKTILNPLSNLLLLSILGIILSPFIWIWGSGSLALKILLSSILSFFYNCQSHKIYKKMYK